MCKTCPCRPASSGLLAAVAVLVAVLLAGPVIAHSVASLLAGLLIAAGVVVAGGFGLIAFLLIRDHRDGDQHPTRQVPASAEQVVVIVETWQRTTVNAPLAPYGRTSVPVELPPATRPAIPPQTQPVPISDGRQREPWL